MINFARQVLNVQELHNMGVEKSFGVVTVESEVVQKLR